MKTLGPHHLQKRKRIFQKHEKYPHPNKWKRLIDKLAYVIGAFSIIVTFPQLIEIWVGMNASGVSAISWSGYLVVAAFWMTYGVAHREKPIIIINALWILLDILIIVGVFIYG